MTTDHTSLIARLYDFGNKASYAYLPFVVKEDCKRAVTALEAAQSLADRLRQEAQIHAQEAKTANATIAEIYQLCTGATGEPGNWNGAQPVRKVLEAAQAEIANLQAYAKHERSLGAEPFAIENNDLRQQLAEIEEKYFVEKGMRRLATGERDEALARLAELEKQEPVGSADRSAYQIVEVLNDDCGKTFEVYFDGKRIGACGWKDAAERIIDTAMAAGASPQPSQSRELSDATIEMLILCTPHEGRASDNIGFIKDCCKRVIAAINAKESK